ncbi:methionine aminotransferase [Algoriphagus formosus]|uniref:Aminotransferase class I/II-fold pyridoxal phosphate-dependent enzyme n=1 Tax=Algoriphagus formosus TaxID=2007308 RepID=A0A4R5US39_9BACT|nr:methionine aminotransferase [Algoriphagus aquimaris]TDK41914.1 aminotransferase class I/II-fold pyridoxal phosphate-dependent enzyme [Algoriphagus aquimaris]
MPLRSKLPHVGTTIFTVMSQMAKDHNAINLSQGFPGFDSDPKLLELVAKYTREGFNQYAPMSGVPALQDVLSAKTARCHDYEPDPETEISIVSGATEAIFCAITAVVKPGDEVLILEPAYDSYEPAILLSGGIPIHIPLKKGDFSIDWERVISSVTFKTKAIVINTPHNPSGYVWSSSDLDHLAQLIRDRNIFVISDEVYEHITFDERKHLSLIGHEELREKSFVCGSFGKTFHVTGWKVGFCIAPPELMEEFRKIHQFVTFSTVTPIQHALAEYLKTPSNYESVSEFYQKKRDFFCQGLKTTGLEFSPAQGSFFQMASYGHLSDISDKELAERMTKELKVACIPVSAFYHNGQDHKFIRFCFAKEDSELQEALGRLEGLKRIL